MHIYQNLNCDFPPETLKFTQIARGTQMSKQSWKQKGKFRHSKTSHEALLLSGWIQSHTNQNSMEVAYEQT